MKTRAAVLCTADAPLPYAQSRPPLVDEVDVAPPGPDEVSVPGDRVVTL